MAHPSGSGRALPTAGGAAPLPPYHLPAIHFASALGWLTVAAVLLPWLAPRLAVGQVFDAPVLALVHVLTLGVVGSAIFGALLQFVPGGLGVPLRSVRVGQMGLVLHQLGVMLLVSGLWSWRGVWQGLGWLLVFAAVGAVSWNVLRVRRQSVHGRLVGWHITMGHSALGAAMLVAAARLGETLGWWHVDRLGLLAAHALLGAIGFGTITALGVASRMVPTFLLGPGNDQRWLERQLWIITGMLGLFTVGHVFGWTVLVSVGGAGLVAASLSVAWLAWRWFARRSRALDAGLWQIAGAFAMVPMAGGIGVMLFADRFAFPRWAALLVALVPGWLVLLIVGVLSRIFTHLSYNALLKRMPGFARLGTPNRLLLPALQWVALVGLWAGTVALIGSLLLQWPTVARGAALTWSVGAMATVANYALMFARGRWLQLSTMAGT